MHRLFRFSLLLGIVSLLFYCDKQSDYVCSLEMEDGVAARLDTLESRQDTLALYALLDSLEAAGNDNLAGEALYRIGLVYYGLESSQRYGFYARALAHFEKGEPLVLERFARLSANTSIPYLEKSGKADSLVSLTRNAVIRLQPYADCGGFDDYLIELHHYLGLGLKDAGDLETAEYYLTKGAEYCNSLDNNYWVCSRLTRELARVQLEMGKPSTARQTMERADYFFSEGADPLDYPYIADNYDTKTEIALATKKNDRLQSFVDSSFHYRNVGGWDSKTIRGNSYNNQGMAAIENNEFRRARLMLDTALKFYAADDAELAMGSCHENYAELYLKQSDTLKALRYLDSAELAYHGDPAQPAIPGAIDRRELRDPLITRALLTLELHQSRPTAFPLAEVRHRVARVDSIFTLLQYGVGSERSKRLNIKRLRRFYEKVVAFGNDNWQRTKQPAYLDFAQTYLERSKGRILRERRRNTFAGIDQDGGRANDAIFAARSRLIRLQQDLRDAPPDRRASVRRDLVQAEEALRNQVDSGSGLAPIDFQPAVATAMAPLLASDLPPNHLVLDYLLGDSSLFVSYSTPTRKGMLRLPANDLERRIDQFLESLEIRGRLRDWNDKDNRPKALADYAQSASELYKSLLGPVLSLEPATTHVTIIPDGPIGFVPFGALLKTAPIECTEETLASWPFAVRDYTFNYEFSADLWADRNQRAYTGGRRALVVSPEQKGHRTITPFGFDQPQLLAELNIEEGEQLQEALDAEFLAGPDARKLREDRNFSDYGILHFSGHGLAAPGNVYRSLLVLDAGADGRATTLSLSDVEALPLNLQMLVLSACQTGLGEVAAEEGVISLGRAGAIAGARSVVTSLWYVNQSAKAKLFRQFYQELADNQVRRDVAMRAAQLSLLDGDYGHVHPYFWAAFVHTGDSEAFDPGFFTAR